MVVITLPNTEGLMLQTHKLFRLYGCFPFSSKLPFGLSDEVNFILKLSVKKATVMGRIMVESLW